MFWERFYELCAQNGVKPNYIAKELGISSGIVSKWKTDGTLPNGENLTKIANYFNCSVDYLLGRDKADDENPQQKSPADIEHSEAMQEAIDIFNSLSDDAQKQALSYLEFLQKK